jgi:hypothetical protein
MPAGLSHIFDSVEKDSISFSSCWRKVESSMQRLSGSVICINLKFE